MLIYLIGLVFLTDAVLLARGERSLVERAIPSSLPAARWLRAGLYFLAALGSFYIAWTYQ